MPLNSLRTLRTAVGIMVSRYRAAIARNKSRCGMRAAHIRCRLGRGVEAMSEMDTGVAAVEQRRAPEQARALDDEERLRVAQRIVRAMSAAGIDCELSEAASTH